MARVSGVRGDRIVPCQRVLCSTIIDAQFKHFWRLCCLPRTFRSNREILKCRRTHTPRPPNITKLRPRPIAMRLNSMAATTMRAASSSLPKLKSSQRPRTSIQTKRTAKASSRSKTSTSWRKLGASARLSKSPGLMPGLYFIQTGVRSHFLYCRGRAIASGTLDHRVLRLLPS
jgi:hypothetical protein